MTARSIVLRRRRSSHADLENHRIPTLPVHGGTYTHVSLGGSCNMLWRRIDEKIFSTHISAPPPANKFAQYGTQTVAGRVPAKAPDQPV
jgi:hypothetical protein